MTLKELIEVLKVFDENKNVNICSIDDIAIVEMPDCIWIDSKKYIEEELEREGI